MAECFFWNWDSCFSDEALHTQKKGKKISAFFRWLKKDPHFDGSGDLVNRAALLEICLGMGIIWKDAHLIQFIEGEHTKETPQHIISSPWTVNEYNTVGDYIERLHKDLLHEIEAPRYVDSVGMYMLLFLSNNIIVISARPALESHQVLKTRPKGLQRGL